MSKEDVDDLMLRRVDGKSQMDGTNNPKSPFYPIVKYAKLVTVNLCSSTSKNAKCIGSILTV